MTMLWRDGGRGWGCARQRLDVVVEELLTGAMPAGPDDESEMQAFLDELRSLGQGPPPPPSAGLSRMLGGAAARPWLRVVDDGEIPAPSGPDSWDPTREVAAAGGSRGRGWTTTAALGKAAALILVVTTAATSAGAHLLPERAQHTVTKAIESVTPFELNDGDDERMLRQTAAAEEGNGDEASAARENGSGGSVEAPTATAGAPDGGAQVPPAVGSAQESDRRSVPPVGDEAATAPTAPSPSSTGAGGRRSPPGGGGTGATPPSPPPSSSTTTLPSESALPPVAGGRVFTATLGRDADPSRSGDPDGSGRAQVSLHSGKNLLCVALTTSGVAPVTSVHLHSVSPTSPDPVVATPAPDSSGSPTCVPVDAEVIRAIRKNPTDHYLDVHNDEFPDGALSGYLSK